jgi:molecular chaperone GrpE
VPKKSKKDEEYEQQIAQATADIQRIQADFVNYKRRADEDSARAVAIGREGTIRALLPSLDNIQRALSHAPEDLKDHDFMKAVASVARQLDKDLSDLGLAQIDTVNEEFNPQTMEAVSMDDEGGDSEIVVEELQSGYTLNDQVIRHAMVKVAKKNQEKGDK